MWKDKKNWNRGLVMLAAVSLLAAAGCGFGDDEAAQVEDNDNEASNADENMDPGGGGGAEPPPGENDGQDPDENDTLPPEEARDYDFSQPAIINHNVYVANETLNSVAIIDSRNLSIRTVLTGVRPTDVVGPGSEGADDGAQVMTLNVGSSTVTMIDPDDHSTSNQPILSDSNRIEMAPGGQHALVWYDPDTDEQGELSGDLSAVSVVSPKGSYEVAVGFRVRDVQFDEDGERALVITNDGVSVLELAEIDSDSFAQPREIIPSSHAEERVRDLNVDVTSDGKYLVAHRHDGAFLLVTDLDEEETYAVELDSPPTGVAFRDGEDGAELVAVLRAAGSVVRAAVPEGFREVAEAQALEAEESENGEGENGEGENGEGENGEGENGEGENGEGENGEGENGEGENGEEDAPEYDDFAIIELPFTGPGSVALSADGQQAFLFTTVGDETRAVLLDVDKEETSVVAFEKTIQGALADERGDTFLVFHDREEGSTEGLTPGDDEYVARKWGFTLFDVTTKTTRLILTDLEVNDATLWSPPVGNALAYMTYAAPQFEGDQKTAHRDVLRVDLGTFSKEVFRLSSLPDGIGVIPEAEKVFVNQIHPQGRMTFVDVDTSDRQTITGYQLNAGID